MNYYEIKQELLSLKHPYPKSKKLRKAFTSLSYLSEVAPDFSYELREFIRLWLTEGVPYAFSNVPYLYERIRSYLADKLYVFPKNIFIIGSGKIGTSLAPKDFPRKFNSKESDLDFTITDNKLFDKLCKDFLDWKEDYENEKCKPKENQKKYWSYNVKRVPNNIKRGFIDIHKIPAYKQYETRYRFTIIVPVLIKLIEIYTGCQYSDRRISFRIYKDWSSFFNQMEFNLKCLIDKIKPNSNNGKDGK